MTITTPRHQKKRPGLVSRIAPAFTARKTVILGGAAIAVPATAASALTAPAEAAVAATPVKAAPGGAIKASPTIVSLKLGSTGELVKVVQQRLRIAVDGNFGPDTDRAVRAFQRSKALYVDGIVGENTWRALGGYPSTPTTPTPPPPTNTNVVEVKYGSTGELVKVVQQRLRIAVDGNFGPGTRTAVKSFQQSKGLYIDGIVGAVTWQALGGFPTNVPTDPTPPTPPPAQCEVTTLRFGSQGALVTVLQKRLGGNVLADGDFGPATLSAVKALQTNKKLPVTGVVDAATWNATGGFPCNVTEPPTTPPPPANSRGQQVVNIAKQYLGVPYVWGGATPSGFDCSGLTQYVYAKAGMSIPRVASAQQRYLQSVSTPQPGDLVFFGSPAYHVGIWVSEGQMIAAPYPGQVVRLQPIYNTPTGFGRFVG